jgi:bifunctional enzyme CysN/CysC
LAYPSLVIIVALVSPFKADRDQARALFNSGEFFEVWVETSALICAQRDPKGLYKKAEKGEIPNLTGVGQEYEAPESAELILDGTEEIEVNVERLIKVIL